MTLPSQSEIDIIATKILFDAKEALAQLKVWNTSIVDGQQKIGLFKDLIKSVAAQIGGDMKAATAAVQSFAKSLGINPTLIKVIGKELQLTAKIAEQLGWSIDAVEKKLAGLAIAVSANASEMVAFSQIFKASISSGIPPLTAIQIVLAAISGQISIIKSQMAGGILGGQGGTPLLGSGMGGSGQPPDYIDAEWEDVADSANKASGAMNNAEGSAKKAGAAGKKAGVETENGMKGAVTAVNVLRIAMGVLVSMLIFQVIQAFQQLFSMAINGLRELETATYNLVNAERILSKSGVDITPKGLDETINKLQELDPLLSRIQATELVSRIATNVAPSAGFDAKQIEDFAKAVATLAVQNKGLGYSFDEVEKQMTDAFLTGKVSQGINRLGIKINDQIVRDEALRLGLVKTADEFDNLTGKVEAQIKAQAMLSVITQKTDEDAKHLPEFMKTADAAFTIAQSRLQDLLTKLGKQFAPLLIEVFGALIRGLESAIKLLDKLQPLIEANVVHAAALFRALDMLSRGDINVFKNYKEGLADAQDALKGIGDYADTATGSLDNMNEAAADNEEALKALEDMEEKIQDIILDAQQAQEDLDLKRDQKNTDLNTEYDRKGVDAAIDHADKLEDINQDALDKIEDAKRKAREDEKKAEQDLLQKLKELRERFLMDLEDALHARDARQVLRLIREYKFDKQNILDKKKLDDQQRADSLAADLAAIEVERKRRIESENIDYQRKLADLAQAKAREQEELKLWYDREQEDIARNVEQKLEKLLAGYIAEGKIHEDNQAAIYATLVKYFGKDMDLVNRLANFMAERFSGIAAMAQQAASLVATASAGMAGFGAVGGYAGGLGSGYSVGGGLASTGGTGGRPGRKGFAEGGSVLATKPTRAIFGERGAELATFTPLARTGKDVNKLFGDVSGGGSASGMAKVLLTLSPDLRGEILSDAMDGVAVVIEHVRRER